MPSPALSALSVSLKSDKSPTFTFQPFSGWGNTDPPPFSLGGPPVDDSADTAARQNGKFFDGGSPTWLFHGAVFALSASGTNQGELQKLIERHGGSVSRTVHKKVDVLVVSQKAMQRNTQHVRKARDKFGIPLVLPNFVHESLSHGEWLATEDYAPSVASTASASASNAATKFKWRRAIRQALRAAPEQTLQLKPLRQQVLAEFGGDAWASLAGADAKRLFRKKLKKVDGLILDGKVVRLMYLC